MFDAAGREEAGRRLRLSVQKYRDTAPKLAAWMESNVPEGLTVLALAPSHRRKPRMTNALERINKEIKRRPRVATLFPDDASVLRLVASLLCEIGEERSAGRVYLEPEPA